MKRQSRNGLQTVLRQRMSTYEGVVIQSLDVKDIRFPTSLQKDGSDAMHSDPDYSCAYVILETNSGEKGYGLTFTLGKGTEVVISGVCALKEFVIGKHVDEIYHNFGSFWRVLTSNSQLRWIGPEKGVIHLATAAVVNALWDLWGRLEEKPVWKLLVDMTPEQTASLIDFRYITDVVTKEEAINMLRERSEGKAKREEQLKETGYPAYTTQAGWLGYSDSKVKILCKEFLQRGFRAFKVKVGQDLGEDRRRCALVRESIGTHNKLMVDANQVWEVEEAIRWSKQLAEFKPLWVEEPTSPDDILGHATIAKALKSYGIGVATGEMCANRVMFKQFLQAGAMEFCQIDSARVGGINEILAIYLMAEKFGVKVCPHGGGVGLCEMVQHLQFWDFVCLSGTKEGRYIEYVDQQHQQFLTPVLLQYGAYIPPTTPGYSTELVEDTLANYEYPTGRVWQGVRNTSL